MDIKYLRRIKGVTRRIRIRNDIIRDELGVELIIHHQLRWFGLLNGMEHSKPTEQVWMGGVQKGIST